MTRFRIVLLFCIALYFCFPDESSSAFIVTSSNEQQDSDDHVSRFIKKRSVTGAEIEIQDVNIKCKVASRFARTVMTSTVLNKANASHEVFFEVELPKTAFITNFSMVIDGKTYVGDVKEKEKAKKQYESAVSSGQSAGLVKASGRKMEKFSVSVNIAASSSVEFVLTYEELLHRSFGKYELMVRVKPKQLVQHFEIVADIYEPQGIAFLDTHATFITNELLPLVEKTVTEKKAHISFSPTLDQQRKCPSCDGTLIDGDFFIKYEVNREKDFGDVQIVNGYFVHFFAPADLPRLPKNVVFVIDVSGSMHGKKIEQTKEALLTIMDDLHEEDHFALVTFHTDIDTWRPIMSKATKENVEEAKKFVKNMRDLYSTNLHGGVMKGIDILKTSTVLPEHSVSMVILLTDGEANSGVIDSATIQDHVRKATSGNITLFCLGFGFSLKFAFLDVLAKQNNGLARRIYEDSDAELQLKGFFDEIANALLSNVNFHYPEDSVNSLTTSHFKEFFNGSEIVVAGRLNDIEMNDIPFEVSADRLEDDFLVKSTAVAQEWDTIFPEQEYIFGDFTERLWAYLTIQQLLDKKDKGSPAEKQNATRDALELSLKYNFVTPLTSLVVIKPEENPDDALIADKLSEDERKETPSFIPYNFASKAISRLSSPVTAVDSDPHFIIELPEQDNALCFNINDQPGTIFNLVRDPQTGIVVNGQTIGDKKVDPENKKSTYFGRFAIIHDKYYIKVMVTTKEIMLSQHDKVTKLFWTENTFVEAENMDLKVTKDRSLTVNLKNSAQFVIVLHKVWKKHPYHQDFLGFYTLDSHLLSPNVHGLLGQFYHGVTFEVSDLIPGQDPGKPDAIMSVKGHKLTVTRGWQKDYRRDLKNGENVPCWFVHKNGTGLIDGVSTDYIVSGLFKTT